MNLQQRFAAQDLENKTQSISVIHQHADLICISTDHIIQSIKSQSLCYCKFCLSESTICTNLLHLLSVVNKLVTLVSEKIYILVVFYIPDKYSFWMDLAISRKHYCVVLSGLIWVQTVKIYQLTYNKHRSRKFRQRGSNSTLTTLFLDQGERILLPLKVDHHWPASKRPFKWHFTGGPMMAHC